MRSSCWSVEYGNCDGLFMLKPAQLFQRFLLLEASGLEVRDLQQGIDSIGVDAQVQEQGACSAQRGR